MYEIFENIGSHGISSTFFHSGRARRGCANPLMLQDWPQGHPEHFDQELADKWNQLLDLRTSVQKVLELGFRQDKTIGHPLDASVTVKEGAAFDALNALVARLG